MLEIVGQNFYLTRMQEERRGKGRSAEPKVDAPALVRHVFNRKSEMGDGAFIKESKLLVAALSLHSQHKKLA